MANLARMQALEEKIEALLTSQVFDLKDQLRDTTARLDRQQQQIIQLICVATGERRTLLSELGLRPQAQGAMAQADIASQFPQR